MGREDWYRNTTWSDATEKDFFERLGRSRQNASKVQYLRIQALYLQDTHPDAANRLLDTMLALPFEQSQIASAYLQKAEVAIRLGRPHEDIVSFFRKSILQQRVFPQVRTIVHRRFGRYAVENAHKELYDEILGILSEYADGEMLPIELYETNGVRAIICEEKGLIKEARQYAAVALQQAAKTESGFRYHKAFGIVEERSSVFDQTLEKIAWR
ncbi:MAG: hypothetical protein HXX11_03265 [Desulfuromonadales bacterium]|nr:hypothetical protein [Desulfuromonadales bacterium]